MMHPDTELRFVSDEVGYGVFARKPIPHGTIVYVRDELEMTFTPDQMDNMSAASRQVVDKYSYIDHGGNHVVSWDHAKSVNHCCDCNTISTGYGFEIALRNIAAGEEITDEYGLFNPVKLMPLHCGKANCRGVVMPDDVDRYADYWDSKVIEALARMQDVAQPLMQYMDRVTLRELLGYLDNSKPYVSVRALRYGSQYMDAAASYVDAS